MTERELNQAIARRTGDDLDTIRRLGFSLQGERPLDELDAAWEDHSIDWEEQEPQNLEWFRHRRTHRSAA